MLTKKRRIVNNIIRRIAMSVKDLTEELERAMFVIMKMIDEYQWFIYYDETCKEAQAEVNRIAELLKHEQENNE
jgi:hypothetical protein